MDGEMFRRIREFATTQHDLEFPDLYCRFMSLRWVDHVMHILHPADECYVESPFSTKVKTLADGFVMQLWNCDGDSDDEEGGSVCVIWSGTNSAADPRCAYGEVPYRKKLHKYTGKSFVQQFCVSPKTYRLSRLLEHCLYTTKQNLADHKVDWAQVFDGVSKEPRRKVIDDWIKHKTIYASREATIVGKKKFAKLKRAAKNAATPKSKRAKTKQKKKSVFEHSSGDDD
eukprot:TRINITY_DN3601_c0_g1_i1.p1 TRINITY_DN3601_c0_g1~~TRINITY_DN3601_c0_g1_i1.p1  ORF type:complete len:228 (-),score=45.90 TRINITY_DN3601_c0_g1_i1:67-750(-)